MTDRKEYIEREQISGVLPPMCPYGDEYSSGYNTCLETVKGLIREAPAADVVEVVRCEVCKKAVRYHHPKGGYLCTLHGKSRSPVVKGCDYCSYGERKDGTGNA